MRGNLVARLGLLFGLGVGCGDEDIDDGTNAEDSSSGAAETSTGTPADESTGGPTSVTTAGTSGDSTAGTSGDSTAGTSGAVADETSTGGDGLCGEPNEQCLEFDAATCTCNGCFDECVTDRGPSSDCVCNVCDDDEFCTDPRNCMDGNGCDPFVEGCQCADCADHPLCN